MPIVFSFGTMFLGRFLFDNELLLALSFFVGLVIGLCVVLFLDRIYFSKKYLPNIVEIINDKGDIYD